MAEWHREHEGTSLQGLALLSSPGGTGPATVGLQHEVESHNPCLLPPLFFSPSPSPPSPAPKTTLSLKQDLLERKGSTTQAQGGPAAPEGPQLPSLSWMQTAA